jgi:hypothetical protein
MNMAVKRSRIELTHHKYLIYTTVEAVTHRDIDKPVTSSNRNLSSAPDKKKCMKVTTLRTSGPKITSKKF